MATDSENRHHDIDVEATTDFDELAARAGAAMRRPAPEHGAEDAVRRGQRRRVITTLAAGGVTIVLVAVGVALLRDGTNPEPTSPVATTTVENTGDSAIARAALISVDQLGPGWSVDFPAGTLDPWRAGTAAQPECAEYVAAVQTLEATAPEVACRSSTCRTSSSPRVSIYPTEEAASSVMDSMEAPGFKDCYFATWDAGYSQRFPRFWPDHEEFRPRCTCCTRRPTDRLRPGNPHDGTIRAHGCFTTIWIQVGRSIIWTSL